MRYLRANGFTATKDSRTGYTGHDLSVQVLGVPRRVQVKVRRDGFRELYGWLSDGADLLIVRADRKKPLIVLSLALAAAVAAKADEH
jgi:hypothetical protein